MRLLEKLKFPSSSKLSKKESPPEKTNVYDVMINALNGEPIKLADYSGKHLFFVNVASECGFTPQYRELQNFSHTFKEKLVVIGYPCNQFANQEPGKASQIQNFCERNFGVTFLLTKKLAVNSAKQHPLYASLTKKELNGIQQSSV